MFVFFSGVVSGSSWSTAVFSLKGSELLSLKLINPERSFVKQLIKALNHLGFPIFHFKKRTEQKKRTEFPRTKRNMEPKNDGMEYELPIQRDYFQVLCWFFEKKTLDFSIFFVDSSLPITDFILKLPVSEVVTWGSPFAGGLDAFEEEF